ncbi:MAG TPA: hypothetical protein VFQ41_24435 [Candidatus Angelobacter sp.]|nr:hypothetical protein [Candidatus Angelobacter sp.]
MKFSLPFLIVMFCFLSSCSSCRQQHVEQQPSPTATPTPTPAGPVTLVDAQETGGATIRVTGVDVAKMHVEVSSMRPGTIVIPVGTVFSSNAADTQTMIAAESVQLMFAGTQAYAAPQIQTIDIEVYCINRFLEAPNTDSSFVVVRGGGELDPVWRLAACLEKEGGDHYSRQLAIWMTSDNFINMTDGEVREKLRSHAMDLLTSDEGIKQLAKAIPDVSEEQLREIRDTPEFRNIVSDAAAKEVEKEIDAYKTKARGLLEKCGADLSASKFFAS